jgi:hypothetical protein
MLSEELRRILRYSNMIVRTAIKVKNKISGLLMETGTAYNKKRLHGRKYFEALLERVAAWRCLRPSRRSWSKPSGKTNESGNWYRG